MERKCKSCGTWNNDEDHCTNCGALISPIKIEEERRTTYEKQQQLRPPNKVDLWLEKISKSKNPLVLFFYYIFYSIWFLLMGLVTIVIYLVIATPG